MNFLPFLFSFLLLFSIGISLSAKRQETTTLVAQGSQTLFKAFHKAASKNASLQFDKMVQKQLQEKKDPSSSSITFSAKTYFRDKKCTKESQKFNLNLLIENKRHPLLFKAALLLLQKLYLHAPFYKEGLEEDILSELLNKGVENLDSLFEDNQNLRAIFYKMRQGTTTYILGTPFGYPSIWDYFSYHTPSLDKMNIKTVSAPVLEALLGPSMFAEVRSLEMREKKCISLKELKALVTASSSESDLLEITSFFTHHSKKDKTATAFVDPESDLLIRY